jgi:hypothetical protein
MFKRINFPFPKVEKPPETLEEKLIFTVTLNDSLIKKPEKTPPPQISGAIPVLSEFYLYFNDILDGLLDLYDIVV